MVVCGGSTQGRKQVIFCTLDLSKLVSINIKYLVTLARKTRQTSSKRASGSGGNAGNPERSSPPVGQCPGSSALDPGRLCRDCGAPRTVPRLGPRMRKGAPWCLTKSAPRPLGQPLGWDLDAEGCSLVPNQVCLPTLGVTLGGDRTPRVSPLGWDLDAEGCPLVPNQVCLPTLGATLGGDRTPRGSPPPPRQGPRMRKGAPWCLTKSASRPLG